MLPLILVRRASWVMMDERSMSLDTCNYPTIPAFYNVEAPIQDRTRGSMSRGTGRFWKIGHIGDIGKARRPGEKRHHYGRRPVPCQDSGDVLWLVSAAKG